MKTKYKSKDSAEIAATVRKITADVCIHCIANGEKPELCKGGEILKSLNCIRDILAADGRI